MCRLQSIAYNAASLCQYLLALPACSTTSPGAPAKIDSPPANLTMPCLAPGELASGATALDLSTWAVEWIDAYGCERSRFAAIARIGASPGSAQTAAVHCSRALRGRLASLRSTLVRPRGCSSLKDARPQPKCSLCGSSRRADLASLSATYLSVHLTIGRS
jgi:hypothetical protein